VGAHRVAGDQERLLAIVGDPELAHLLPHLLDCERHQGLGILAHRRQVVGARTRLGPRPVRGDLQYQGLGGLHLGIAQGRAELRWILLEVRRAEGP
jgi:hypothetical protein